MNEIRKFRDSDWPSLWMILRATNEAADTFAFDTDTSEEFMRHLWVKAPAVAYVLCDDGGRVLGSYYVKPNQPGHGSHVCNAGYVVAASARGQGIGQLLCEHSQRVAKDLGFRSMQFNFVVSTNAGAVHLWKKMGFAIVGTLPGAFRHQDGRFVDAFVMFKDLV